MSTSTFCLGELWYWKWGYRNSIDDTVYQVIFARKKVSESVENCKIKHYEYFVYMYIEFLACVN